MYNSSPHARTRGDSLTHAASECTPRSSLARVYVTTATIARDDRSRKLPGVARSRSPHLVTALPVIIRAAGDKRRECVSICRLEYSEYRRTVYEFDSMWKGPATSPMISRCDDLSVNLSFFLCRGKWSAKVLNPICMTGRRWDLPPVLFRSPGRYRELPAREPEHPRNNSSANSPRSRIDRINHFVGHRSDHVVAPFHRLGSAQLGLSWSNARSFSVHELPAAYNAHRPLAGRCIGLKIIAGVAWRLPSWKKNRYYPSISPTERDFDEDGYR